MIRPAAEVPDDRPMISPRRRLTSSSDHGNSGHYVTRAFGCAQVPNTSGVRCCLASPACRTREANPRGRHRLPVLNDLDGWQSATCISASVGCHRAQSSLLFPLSCKPSFSDPEQFYRLTQPAHPGYLAHCCSRRRLDLAMKD